MCALKWRHKHKPFGPFQPGHKTRVGMKHPRSFIEGRKGKGNPMWKGENVKRKSVHSWINDNFGKEESCEMCGLEYSGEETRKFDWSNKEHNYESRKREDWQFLCRSCHMKYDYDKGFRKGAGGHKNKTRG